MGKDEAKNKLPEVPDKELQDRIADLEQREQQLDEKEKALTEREAAIHARFNVDPEPESEPELTKAEQELIKTGCKAYGIDERYLFTFGIDRKTGEAVLVTNGGAKVRFKKGMDVEPLEPVRVDGISRKKPRYVAGKKK